MTVVRANEKLEERKRSEPTLGEELAAFGDDDVVEMTNLQEKDTGIPGVDLHLHKHGIARAAGEVLPEDGPASTKLLGRHQ